jgi:arginine N-succinyltransferase
MIMVRTVAGRVFVKVMTEVDANAIREDIPDRYEICAATPEDHDELYELARYLDTVNLPRDSAAISRLLRTSEASFLGQICDARYREFVFVLRDLHENRAIGTSTVIGQLGRRDAPYIYFDVREEERYSATLDRHFVHRVLSIGYSYDGPTEVGGLVLHPDYRKSTLKLGKLISHVRFLWIAMHRAQFQDQVLAELLPPLEPDGTSHLWEAVGRRFTGLSYAEADRLSKNNKEFIRGLFPAGDIYVSLLADDAQSVIGKVGAQTQGVQKMLSDIGFRYANRIDPFDGGPHFMASTDRIPIVRNARFVPVLAGQPHTATRYMAAAELVHPPYLRARLVDGELRDGQLVIHPDAKVWFPGSWVTCLPFPSIPSSAPAGRMV